MIKTFTLCLMCLLLCVRSAFADDERVSTLTALDFSKTKSAKIALLGMPTKDHASNFHGCALLSEWIKMDRAAAYILGWSLETLIARDLAKWKQVGDREAVILSPLGFIYGDLAIRLETDRGTREFAVSLKSSGSLYAYDQKKHSLYLSIDPELLKQLQSIAAKLAQNKQGSSERL